MIDYFKRDFEWQLSKRDDFIVPLYEKYVPNQKFITLDKGSSVLRWQKTPLLKTQEGKL